MNDTNKSEPAFPTLADNGHAMNQDGMTLRDYFASKGLQGMLADSNISGTPTEFAIRAYALADAMLKAKEL